MSIRKSGVRILICGVPGTGKTTVGAYVAAQVGCIALDMEAHRFAGREHLKERPSDFISHLAINDGPAVLSWGFGPVTDMKDVLFLTRTHQFRMVWLDGDRVASFREFMVREKNDPVMENMYYGQMFSITTSGILDRISMIRVNPFRGGVFRDVQEIAGEIVEKTRVATVET